MTEKLSVQVDFEIRQIEQLLKTYADLLDNSQQSDPSLVEITAIASVLHSFYNGIENIFLSIAKQFDANVPEGPQWHRDLLVQMTRTTSTRSPVLSENTVQLLTGYLGFRHFYRHSYSFVLDWTEISKLVIPLLQVWKGLRRELRAFQRTLN